LPKKSKQSAKGAKYESQGQARSEAERVAPGERERSDPALKARNTRDISAFQALFDRAYRNQGRRASLCPALAPGFIFCAFGALFRLLGKANLLNLIQ
jgi:hypothetical protein